MMLAGSRSQPVELISFAAQGTEYGLRQSVIFMSLFLSLCHAVWLFSADEHVGVALQFESGYFVETLVEGDKLGVTPHTIRVSPVEGGELLAVDSAHSNIVRITPPLSECMFHFPPPLIGVCFILLYIFIYLSHCSLYGAHVVCFHFLVDSGHNGTMHT